MGIEGRWWPLIDDEPLSYDNGTVYELRAGDIRDGRTAEKIGSYTMTDEGPDLIFSERHGEIEVQRFRMEQYVGVASEPFDHDADGYRIFYSTARYDAYKAKRESEKSAANDAETDEERYARQDWESEEFGFIHPYGHVLRETPWVIETGMQNDRESAAYLRREKIKAVN
jgi:hypothetical protein